MVFWKFLSHNTLDFFVFLFVTLQLFCLYIIISDFMFLEFLCIPMCVSLLLCISHVFSLPLYFSVHLFILFFSSLFVFILSHFIIYIYFLGRIRWDVGAKQP